ncbi:MAG: hypothetical protein V1737_05940 [Chloroflexota bacterium]
MKAMVLKGTCEVRVEGRATRDEGLPLKSEPLELSDLPCPVPGPKEVLIEVDLRGLCAWSLLVGLTWVGRRFLNFSNRFLVYANEAVLPFYILHQTVILMVGFFVVQWSMGILPKYLVTSASSFVVIVAIYHLAVRRTSILRLLFGMRLKARLTRPAATLPS